jgi:hypothetical protein
MEVSIMEGRRLGIIRKPVLVVPSFMLEQHVRDFKDAYPNANIKVLGTGTSEADIGKVKLSQNAKWDAEKYEKESEKNRMQRYKSLADVMYGDYDVTIMTYESFERIPMSPEFEENFIRGEIDKLRVAMDGAGDYTVKEIQNAIDKLEKRVAEMKSTKKDQAISFEEIGFDALFVDEAHNFKNLMYFSKMGNIGGLSNSSAFRSWDMYMKTAHMNQVGNKTIFATGTPIANSVAEMFTMLRYLAPKKLAEFDMEHFDGWAAQFGTTINSVELNTSGKFVERTRFSEFMNVPELMNMFKDVADVKMAEDLPYLKRPEFTRETVTSPMSDNQKTYMELMVRRAENMPDEPQMDNMLKLTGEGKKLALDYRIIDGGADNEKESKLNVVAEHVAHEYFSTAKGNAVREDMHDRVGKTFDNGTQIVFMDLGVPKASDDKKTTNDDGSDDDAVDTQSASMYQNLKDRLIELGVKEKDIAFIHDYKDAGAKRKLSEMFNEGKIRVLIGSTGKMGVGMNLQNRLTMLHHADPTWRPADIEQREGRIIRQGNYNPKVKIKTYVTGGSFDALMWNTLENKAKFIAQVMSGDSKVRTMEEIAEMILSYSEVKADATGNEAMKKLHVAEKKLRELKDLESEHNKNQAEYEARIKQLPDRIAKEKTSLQASEEAEKAAIDIGGDNFTATMDGVDYSEKARPKDDKEYNPRKAFREALIAKLKPLQDVVDERESSNHVATVGGLELRYDVEKRGTDREGNYLYAKKLYLQFTASNGKTMSYVDINLGLALEKEGQGFITRMQNSLKALTTTSFSPAKKEAIKKWEIALEDAEKNSNKPFDKKKELEDLNHSIPDLREEARQFELTNSFDTVFQMGKDHYVVTGHFYIEVESKSKKKQKDKKPDYQIGVKVQKIAEIQKDVEYLDEHNQPHTVSVFKMSNEEMKMRDIDFIGKSERRPDIVGISESTFRNRLAEIDRLKREKAAQEAEEKEKEQATGEIHEAQPEQAPSEPSQPKQPSQPSNPAPTNRPDLHYRKIKGWGMATVQKMEYQG